MKGAPPALVVAAGGSWRGRPGLSFVLRKKRLQPVRSVDLGALQAGDFAGARSMRSKPDPVAATCHDFSGAMRARRRLSVQPVVPSAPWAVSICQRLSTPDAPPAPGVRISPRGGAARAAPASAARCNRRIGVRAGGAGRSAITSGIAAERSASSMVQSRSISRVGATKIRRPGSINRATPVAFRRPAAHPGSIHNTGPASARAISIAKVTRAEPHPSCTRPGANLSPSKNAGLSPAAAR